MTALAFATAVVGCICLAGGLHGYLLAVARMWERALLVVAGVLLIAPELYSSIVGLVLLGVVIAAQLPRRRARRRRQFNGESGNRDNMTPCAAIACGCFTRAEWIPEMKEGTAASRALRDCLSSGDQAATTLCLALPWTVRTVSRMGLLTACWPPTCSM